MRAITRNIRQFGKDHLKELLAERNQNPGAIPAIDERIRATFERRVALLCLDMSGFSRISAKYGIIQYLAMIHQMEEAATPAVVGNRGLVIKQEADNLFAIFNTPDDALEGALDIFRAFEAVNSVVPDERDICGSIGIGYGETLVIGDDDLFGAEMNFACKLGEDLAERGEILLTEAARVGMLGDRHAFEPITFTVSGVVIEAHRYLEPPPIP